MKCLHSLDVSGMLLIPANCLRSILILTMDNISYSTETISASKPGPSRAHKVNAHEIVATAHDHRGFYRKAIFSPISDEGL
jgi:hypothetical protein